MWALVGLYLLGIPQAWDAQQNERRILGHGWKTVLVLSLLWPLTSAFFIFVYVPIVTIMRWLGRLG